MSQEDERKDVAGDEREGLVKKRILIRYLAVLLNKVYQYSKDSGFEPWTYFL